MTWTLQELPFFEPRHRRLADRVVQWCRANEDRLGHDGHENFDEQCRAIVMSLGNAGLLDCILPQRQDDGSIVFDVRSICLVREGLAYASNLAATLFSLQGMGFASLLRMPRSKTWNNLLDRARTGEVLGAIAISEEHAGSDVSAIRSTARAQGDAYCLDGEKTWIANGSIADFLFILAKCQEDGEEHIGAFIVDAKLPGVTSARVEMGDGCPLARVSLSNVLVPASHRLGSGRNGMKLAFAGFDLFRPSVGAAAVGLAQRAFDETVDRVMNRKIFGKSLAENDVVRARLAEMHCDIETSLLTVYRAAWAADMLGGRRSNEAAVAKLVPTEAAQRVIDYAVQMAGAYGTSTGAIVERLYREVRPMRIYEGASEIQKVIIARNILREKAAEQ